MSKELIKEMRIVGRYYADQKIAKLLEAGADALEAKVAPVGELREAFEAAMDSIGKSAGQWLDGEYKNPYGQAAWLGFQAGAAYQRAQQPQSAEEVHEYALRSRIADLLHLLQFAKIETSTPTDAAQAEIAMNDLEAMLSSAPQPSAGVVMPERKVNHNGDPQKWMDWRDGWNACLDEFARLNGKEVGRG